MSTPLPPAAQTLKVVINGNTSAGRNWANILHFRYTGTAPTVSNCEGLATAILSDFVTNITPLQGADINSTGCYITDLTSDTSAEGGFEATTPGTLSGSPIPGGAAMLCSYSILYRYRGGHPRQYLVVGTEASLLDTSDWQADFVTSCEEAWAAFLASVSGTTSGGTTVAGQVAVSYYQANARRDAAFIIPLSFTGCSNVVASQRRRTRRRS